MTALSSGPGPATSVKTLMLTGWYPGVEAPNGGRAHRETLLLARHTRWASEQKPAFLSRASLPLTQPKAATLSLRRYIKLFNIRFSVADVQGGPADPSVALLILAPVGVGICLGEGTCLTENLGHRQSTPAILSSCRGGLS